MKREGLRHPKMMDLAARLSINHREAIGLLDLLFDWAIDYAIRGDIGKWTDAVIAGSVGWTEDASTLVTALVESGWLERSKEHRLIIHDWPDHVPMFARAKMKKLRLTFLECYESEKSPENNPEASTVATKEPSKEGDTNPLPSLPLPSNPLPPQPAAAGPQEAWEGVEEVLFSHGVALAPKAVKAARDAGCNPMQVLNCIEFWRANQPKWKPGALYERITRLRPEQGFDQLWPDNVSESGARQVSADEFRRLFEAGRFSKKPEHHATKPEIVFGTLRTGERIECRSYPVTKKKKQEATA